MARARVCSPHNSEHAGVHGKVNIIKMGLQDAGAAASAADGFIVVDTGIIANKATK